MFEYTVDRVTCSLWLVYILTGWMADADSRPTFTELHSEFAKMSTDPGRYLCIQVKFKQIFPRSLLNF